MAAQDQRNVPLEAPHQEVRELKEHVRNAHLTRIQRYVSFVLLALILVSAVVSTVRLQYLASCVSRVISTTNERGQYTDDLRKLTDADQQNLNTLVNTITTALSSDYNPSTISEALAKYNGQAASISRKREQTRKKQDAHAFPSLSNCYRSAG